METNIPCPKCHASFPVQFDQVGPGKTCLCPKCGTAIRFSGQDLGKIQQALTQLSTQVGNAALKVTVKTNVRRPWWKFWG